MLSLLSKIIDQSGKIGILVQGCVGLPLAMAFEKKFTVFGFDVCSYTIENLQAGKSHKQDITGKQLSRFLIHTYFPTSDPEDLLQCDLLIICAPTLLSKDKIPDLAYVKNACKTIKTVLQLGQFVILEIIIYPGTMVIISILEETELKSGTDFGIAYFPEKVSPRYKYPINKVPTAVGGISTKCNEIVTALYGSIVDRTVPVRNARTLELVKMVDNIFRNVNTAVNELSLIFERMEINT